jgi:hypothetical protein
LTGAEAVYLSDSNSDAHTATGDGSATERDAASDGATSDRAVEQ